MRCKWGHAQRTTLRFTRGGGRRPYVPLRKKIKVELIFLEQRGLLREKPAIVAFAKFRLSSALLDSEGEIWPLLAGESAVGRAHGDRARGECSP
jgi:hypothetical protein